MPKADQDPLTQIMRKLDRIGATCDNLANQVNEMSLRVSRGNMKLNVLRDSVSDLSDASSSVADKVVALTAASTTVTETLGKIADVVIPVTTAAAIEFYTTINGVQTKVDKMNMKATQTLQLAIAIKDAQGNPALVDGAPVWSVTDQTLGAVIAAADGMSAVFTPAGPLGSCAVQVNADADLGAGVNTLVGELAIDIVAGEASTIAISGVAVDPA